MGFHYTHPSTVAASEMSSFHFLIGLEMAAFLQDSSAHLLSKFYGVTIRCTELSSSGKSRLCCRLKTHFMQPFNMRINLKKNSCVTVS